MYLYKKTLYSSFFLITTQGGESSIAWWRNVQMAKRPGGETSRGRNVLRAKCPDGETSRVRNVQGAKRLGGESSRGRTDKGAKRP